MLDINHTLIAALFIHLREKLCDEMSCMKNWHHKATSKEKDQDLAIDVTETNSQVQKLSSTTKS